MSYALFAKRKVVLTGNLNALNLQQTQRSDEQYNLATHSLSLQQQMGAMQAAQSSQLAGLYGQLVSATTSAARTRINDQISRLEASFESELQGINNQIYLVSVKENVIEMAVKRLDTQISTVQKQLEALEEAEGKGIDRATPKFNGVG